MPLQRTLPIISFFVFLLFGFISCKKEIESIANIISTTTPRPSPEAASTGIASGDPVSKEIGPDGGSIVSRDGASELSIPAGALSSNTTITMQPISNTCPGGLANGFRFGPDGLHFDQPATLKMNYTTDILKSTFSDFMGIGYQDSSGYWHRIKQLTNDTANRILTASIQHFTDYAPFTLLSIDPPAATLRPGMTQYLHVQVNESDDDDIPPLPGTITSDPYIIVYEDGKCIWEINGGQHTADFGQFTTDNGTLAIGYEAPQHVPATGNPVAISATIDMGGMKLNGKKYNKTILVSNINISENLVFMVDIEMNTTGNSTSPSGELITNYKDGATFKVTMVYDPKQGVDTAIISDTANRAPELSPTYFNHSEGSYNSTTYTWIPDAFGEINVVGGSGQGLPGPNEEILLTLNHKGTRFPGWATKICSYNGCTTSPSGGDIPGTPLSLGFPVLNEPKMYPLQTDNNGNNVLTATVTPLH